MKTRYVKPEIEMVKMEMAQLIAGSDTATVPDGNEWQTNAQNPMWREFHL